MAHFFLALQSGREVLLAAAEAIKMAFLVCKGPAVGPTLAGECCACWDSVPVRVRPGVSESKGLSQTRDKPPAAASSRDVLLGEPRNYGLPLLSPAPHQV